MKPCHVIGVCLFCVVRVSICLVVRVSIPPNRQRGDSANLSCAYELEDGERLYSVKWYRDNEEFYRYIPRLRPPQHSHNVEGVRVNMEKSNARRVHLENLTLRTRGTYRCEVSAEAPSFASAQAEAYMEVYYFPKENPRITGHERRYSAGEPLDVNCTSARSFPASVLDWYINDRKVTEHTWLTRHGWWRVSHGLVVSGVGLRAPAEHRMTLRCTAKLAAHTRDQTVFIDVSSSARSWPSRALQTFLLLVISRMYRYLDKLSDKIT